MLRRLLIRDFAIVSAIELDWAAGFTALTGETGAGKSILIDALQLALGHRADAGSVREGAARADISAEFDTPDSLSGWLAEGGFESEDGGLLLRRSVDAAGKSRAWINGHPATAAQLREVADHVLDIHGQHAWQGLTRPAAVRDLLDALAEAEDEAARVRSAWQAWRETVQALDRARHESEALARQREGLAWQVGELQRLSPREGEWSELDAEHRRLSHGQSLMEGAQQGLDLLDGDEGSALETLGKALHRLQDMQRHDERLEALTQTLSDAQGLVQDAAHELRGYLGRADLDPARLAQLDERLSAWLSLARRLRQAPADLPACLERWSRELADLERASDLEALEARCASALADFESAARALSRARRRAAPQIAEQVTQTMQQLGMGGGRFEIALTAESEPQAWGRESVEFRVAGHEGSTPRALAKVASGGELSRLALAIAVVTTRNDRSGAATLIFDEIDAGIGGAVADTVGRLMKQLGRRRQVLSVTHLAQVASCADHHLVVSKRALSGQTASTVTPVEGEARVAELARMLGGDRLSTGTAHAQSLLDSGRS